MIRSLRLPLNLKSNKNNHLHQIHSSPKQDMSQIPAHLGTNTPFTVSSFQKLVDLSLSSSGLTSIPLLFTQFKHLINLDLCNSLIRTSASSNNHLRSILVYTHMTKIAITPDLSTFPSLLKSVAQLILPGIGIPVHGCIAKMGFGADVVVNTALVSMYCSFASVSDGRRVFDEMPERNSVSWNAMITGYVHNREFKEAHALFSRMLVSGFELGEVTMVSALSACAHLGALNQGVWIHNYIKNNGLRFNVFVGTALIDMYMKCGEVDEAVNAFQAMRVKNVFSWNALISGFAINGRGLSAMMAFDAMARVKVKPDQVTILAILSACCHQGLVDEGRRIFINMEREYGLVPRIEHYGCMIDLLGRAGSLEEAYELVQTMPREPDAVIWRSLLTACRIHRNTQLGEVAARKLLELEPDNGENYILLSNVLARDRRWAGVGKVRKMMSQRGIEKVPGCSSIEVDNVVYEFTVTDQFEKQFAEIYKMLDHMKRELRSAGYVVDTEMASYDLEEEETENSLMHHSEKLALAFGLLRTPHGSVIRIVKNLRVCNDCHSFFKLVSEVYQRKLVVRDRTRFHHFSDGICSCRDYW
ncbi:pentatricopeptide repeat-containing protein At1g08070, chloroplastic-like [Typha angustifolia]|uniref:pentatricopeptide repeat-containing protein At1g08070, chloroplastic-like n=1 Tax=Typha angustifolia TaxID=59011 RepID=UPI003C2B02CB